MCKTLKQSGVKKIPNHLTEPKLLPILIKTENVHSKNYDIIQTSTLNWNFT